MKNEYTIDFCSDRNKLKCRLYFNNKVYKTKTFPITVSTLDIKTPSPILEKMLLNIRSQFNDLIIECYGSNRSPLKLMFQSKNVENKTPYEFFAETHDYRLKRWYAFIDKDLAWGDVSDELLTDYHSFLESEEVATNTIKAYLCGLKKALDDAKLRGYKISSREYASILKAPTASAISIYLTMEELAMMERVELPNKLNDVRVKFLIGAYSGARYSDFSRLTTANINSGEVNYISEKTGSLSRIPLHPKLPTLLGQYKSDISNSLMNRLLPRIGEMAGVNSMVSVVRGDKRIEKEKWNFIKSHTGRRTFATNLYLDGVPLFSISKMLGHKAITTTQTYIACGINNEEVLKSNYFNN